MVIKGACFQSYSTNRKKKAPFIQTQFPWEDVTINRLEVSD